MIDSVAFGCEPAIWTLCFSKTATTRLRSFLAFGRYKHVRAYAYLPGLKAWLFYDVHLRGTTLAVMPDDAQALAVICEWMTDSDLIRIRKSGSSTFFGRFGFWCVPAMAHLTAVRCPIPTPDAFYRACLRQGAQRFEGIDGSASLRAAVA